MTGNRFIAFLAFSIITLGIVNLAEARQFRVDQVPNNEYDCGLCHQDGIGGADRNSFGQQVQQNLTSSGQEGDVQWGEIYQLDADGDGFTNGEELGDPDGDWEIGDPDPEFEPSHPAKPAQTPCEEGTNSDSPVCSESEPGGDVSDSANDTSETATVDGATDVSTGKDAMASDDGDDKSRDRTSSPESNGCGCSKSGDTPSGSVYLALLAFSGLVIRRRLT